MPANKTLISTKIQMPFLRPDHVNRERIVNRLEDKLEMEGHFTRKVTLISAPAGYGKTTAAAAWLEKRKHGVCWLSIDEGDNDPVLFWSYLVNAFQSANEAIGRSVMPFLKSPRLPSAPVMLSPLVNDIVEFGEPVIMALDDYHLISLMAIHVGMRFLVENAPANLHVVIISREDPPFPLHSLRARSQINEIRQRDLVFTQEETGDFLSGTGKMDVDNAIVAQVNQRTEGWVTGIQLAALTIAHTKDINAAVRSMSERSGYILDYLFKEIFQSLTGEQQAFLLATAILDQFTPSLAAAVSGCENCEEIINSLYQANLFIFPITIGSEWFRYHQLLKTMLQHQLTKDTRFSKDDLHLKASNWYRENGFMQESIRHALFGHHWERAVQMIGIESDFLLKNGRIATLLNWLKMIPETYFDQSADLCLTYTWPLLLSGQLEQAGAFISKAKAITDEGTEQMGQVAAADAYLAQTKGNMKALIAHSEKALALLPADDRSSRGIVAMNLGMAFWHQGMMRNAEAPLLEAVQAASESGNPYAEITARLFLARIDAVKGNLLKAIAETQKLLDNPKGLPIELLALTDIAMYQYEWNQRDKALVTIDSALDAMEKGSIVEFTLAASLIKVRILSALEMHTERDALLEKCGGLCAHPSISPVLRSRCAALHVEQALERGDITTAKEWFARCSIPEDAHPFYRFLNLSPIRIAIAQNDRQAANLLIIENIGIAEKNGWNYGLAWLLIRRALLADDPKNSSADMEKAIAIGQHGNLIRTFLDAGTDAVAPLLRSGGNEETASYVEKLLAAIEESGSGRIEPIDNGGLSDREIEVLQLAAQGLTNQQIAEDLVVSISTVKSHMHHIYTKLDTANRTQALAKSRQLGIIP